MKWVKVAIGAVIAIMSIGIIATSVYNMTQESEVTKEVEFTVNVNDGTYTPNVFDEIMLYSDIGNDDIVSNISLVKLNNGVTNDLFLQIKGEGSFSIVSISLDGEDGFNHDGTFSQEDNVFQDSDIVTILFEVTQPPQLTGISATLILLAPLIFAGGVLAYLLNKREL